MASMERCPCCDRQFKSITDYPVVLLKGMERFEIPTRFVYENDTKLYVDAEGKRTHNVGNELVPDDVFNLFQETQGNTVDFEGFQWRRDNLSGSYSYQKNITEELGDRRNQLATRLEPYFKRLEEAVGNEVQTQLLLPPSIEDILRREQLDLIDDYTSGQSRVDLTKARLEITYIEGHIGLNHLTGFLGTLATFDYEGRLRADHPQ